MRVVSDLLGRSDSSIYTGWNATPQYRKVWEGPRKFNAPNGLAVAHDGTFLTSFGEKGGGPAQFQHAISVAIADDGTVFAADYGNNRIQKWKPSY